MTLNIRLTLSRTWLVLGTGLLMSTASTAQLLVNPVVIELGANQRVATVKITLSSTAKAAVRLQAELLRWQQSLQGEDITQANSELLVTPPIADLRPGETQLFRVAVRGGRTAPEELAYRLILEDIAEPVAPDNTATDIAISFRMRYDLPVMVAPVGKVMNALRWKPCPALATTPAPRSAAVDTEACMRLFNAGNRRVKVQTIHWSGDGWQQAQPLAEGVNILVGAEREWRIPLQAGKSGGLRGIQIQTARGETLQAEAEGF
ncbi:MAG: fimbria/pilus periplasmic chaperone [Pseudomonadota bacterium]